MSAVGGAGGNARATLSLAIIGGGAAGLMAAVTAGRTLASSGIDPSSRLAVLERGPRVGRKILATGNGQCNLSHLPLNMDHYHGRSPGFARAALGRLTVEQTLAFWRGLGLVTRVDDNGRVYPYNRQASAVLDCLRAELERLSIPSILGFTAVRLDDTPDRRRIAITGADGSRILAEKVIVASGGLAGPAFGCDGSGYTLCAAFRHPTVDPRPAVAPIETDVTWSKAFAGLRLDAAASLSTGSQPKIQMTFGEVLFTDYGLSGPAIFNLARATSDILARGDKAPRIELDLLPDWPAEALSELLNELKTAITGRPAVDLMAGLLPKRVAQTLVRRCCPARRTDAAADLSASDLDALTACAKAWPCPVRRVRGFAQAQVTAGGLDVRHFRPDTMESTLRCGLYAAGEVLDIDGDCGGYNLQWAWSSGWVAGRHAAESLLGKTSDGSRCDRSR